MAACNDDGATAAASHEECAVCLSELAAAGGSNDDVAAAGVQRLAGCGHGFHAECIGRWLPLRRECPLCRRPVRVEEPAWARPATIACGFGGGRVVWTRSPSVRQ